MARKVRGGACAPRTHLARERHALQGRCAPQYANHECNERADGFDEDLRGRVTAPSSFISYEGRRGEEARTTHVWGDPRAEDALHLEATRICGYPGCKGQCEPSQRSSWWETRDEYGSPCQAE